MGFTRKDLDKCYDCVGDGKDGFLGVRIIAAEEDKNNFREALRSCEIYAFLGGDEYELIEIKMNAARRCECPYRKHRGQKNREDAADRLGLE